jgi:hypothetical protein
VVSVIKRADWKGNGRAVVDALMASPEGRNPAVVLWMQMQSQLDPQDPGAILALEPTIAAAIEVGDQEIAAVQQAFTRLVECAPVPATRIPLGF